ncbi:MULTISPECIES: DUF3313 domain-containing protein [Citrobacter freundii complex]|uniref:DUF3313 domain-containing protein n=2 Tax=Citrobacter TaxID=544 RepID=UPI0018314949|nr:DUF3313 domain-containing protein [Salmonella enterica]
MSSKFFLLTITILSSIMTGCTGYKSVHYTDIDSSSRLKKHEGENADHLLYTWYSGADWKKYTSVIIDPVQIYQGKDNEFNEIGQSDRQELATYMQVHFKKALTLQFNEITTPVANTLRIKLTLTGAATTPQFIGTLTKFDLAGGPYNIVQSIRGKEGMLSGSVNYVVEVFDATDGQLLMAYIARQYPNAMDISSSIGALSAAETGIDKGAKELAELLKH